MYKSTLEDIFQKNINEFAKLGIPKGIAETSLI